ncbi:hypothetical protein LPJ64_000552 [Coemansia asiatica]|uniref:Uncharacterized protein n=1 Tax=Coemansia asiatica TaxID=1052880 RepID=A0A9W7XRN7_9FUNG|nr:hypothetical protein LPJ64_000552 [Coemansia asiatica]
MNNNKKSRPKLIPASINSRRTSSRLAAKVHPVKETQPKEKKTAEKPKSSDKNLSKEGNNDLEPQNVQNGLVQDFMERLDAISSKLSQLALNKLGRSFSSENIAKNKTDATTPSARQSVDSEKTLVPIYPIVESREKDICKKLFAPVSSLPEPDQLSERLLDKLEEPIPIHNFIFSELEKEIPKDILEKNFCIVEQVGNICPTLTPRVENALMVSVVGKGTEMMQQHVLDAFLMSIFCTANTQCIDSDMVIDRNAAESSATISGNRPDFLFAINGQLVFKGEEKKGGNVRTIALELTSKMIPGSVGKPDSRIEYMLGYATAGSRILFECIYDDGQMKECSGILNLERMPDRVSMIIILVNILRIARTLVQTNK